MTPTCTLTVLHGSERGHEHIAVAPRFRIGKQADNDLVLVDPTISRHHCELIHDGRGWLVRDRESTNGTILDGARIKEAYIKNGAVLSVGAIDFKLRLGRRELAPSKPLPEPFAADDVRSFAPGKSYRDTKAEWEADFERRFVAWLLARHDGNISAAAREVSMDRKYLHKLVAKHGVRNDE